MRALYLIVGASVSEELSAQASEEIQKQLGASPVRLAAGEALPQLKEAPKEEPLVFLLLSDEEYQEHIRAYARYPVALILLPCSANPRVQKEFLLPKSVADALALATEEAQTTPQKTLTLCNDRVVLGEVTLGEAEWLRSLAPFKWLVHFLRHFLALRLRPLYIETAKGRGIETAALIISVAHERTHSRLRPYFFNPDENLCARVAAAIYAPLSLFAIFRLRLYRYRPDKRSASLPLGIGTLKSQKLTIRSLAGAMPLYRDNAMEYVSEAVVESVAIEARLLLPQEPCIQGDADKESIRVQKIPTDKELIEYYTRRRLPFVPVAPEELFADLFTTLREGARLDSAYLLLLIVSVLMAATGLFQNSSPTIIGAMILAPLMAPIISLSMGLMRFDRSLLRRSGVTLVVSILLALLTAAALAWLLPFSHQTEQMAMRTHPTLLDLAVAILSGIAAAYGYTNSKVGQSLAGVAIAVALVPPLSVAGIGLGWGELSMFSGAFLLFLANFAGIILAAGSTFYLLGFTSWRYASSAFVLKLLLIALIAIPLWLSTETLIREEKIQRIFDTLKVLHINDNDVPIHLKRIYKGKDALYTEVVVFLPPRLDADAQKRIAQILRKKVGKDVKLVIAYRYLY